MIKLNISNEKTGITISLKSTEALSVDELQSIYNLVNKTKPAAVAIEMPSQGLERFFDKFPKAVPLKEEGKSRPRAIELLNTEHRLSTPIGELFIKPEYNHKNVKAYVNCPECGHEGDRFVYEGNSYTKCPACETKLFNSYATDASLTPNEDGYTYMATSVIIPKRRYEDTEDACDE